MTADNTQLIDSQAAADLLGMKDRSYLGRLVRHGQIPLAAAPESTKHNLLFREPDVLACKAQVDAMPRTPNGVRRQPGKSLISTDDAAARTGIARTRIGWAAQHGRIRGEKRGGTRWYVDVASLDAYAKTFRHRRSRKGGRAKPLTAKVAEMRARSAQPEARNAIGRIEDRLAAIEAKVDGLAANIAAFVNALN